MAYRIKIKQLIEPEVQRVALEQIDKALSEIDNDELDQPQTIHQVRKRCKKIRAILRLVRSSLSNPQTYKFENAFFRDAARSLSDIRDVEAVIESYDKLMKIFSRDVDLRRFGDIDNKLFGNREQLTGQTNELPDNLHAFKEQMVKARKRIDTWRLTADSSEASARGLKRTYRRGRKAMDAAYKDPSCENFHEWRKRVKYHWYHCRLLRELWTPVIKARIGELDKLATLLGDYHDLDLLRQRAEHLSEKSADSYATARLLNMIEQRQKEIRSDAHPHGKKIFAEKPRNLSRRFQHYWNA